MQCDKTQLTFLISNLILNREVTVGNIIDVDKILQQCQNCKKDDIESILECFVENKLLIKTPTYICKNEEHHFTPQEEDSDGYLCYKCLDKGLDEEECFLDKDEFGSHLVKNTYRVNTHENPQIWQAKSLYMIGDVEKAITILYPLIKDEISTENNPKSIAEKISPYFGIAGSTATIADKIMPAVEMFIKSL